MKAALIQQYGGPEVVELADVSSPKPKEDEVVIQVAATSVNPIDWLVRDGAATSFVKVKFPVILGCELAGKVVEVGARVTRLSVGDEVFAMMPTHWGANAERVALAEDLVVKKPAGLTMKEAAAIPVAATTSLRGIVTSAQIRRGERILINGASGGVGLAAVQIAKAHGAIITAVCSRDSFERVKALGADELIDYKTTDFTTGEATYDVIFDCIGNVPYAKCSGVLRGRRVHVTTMPTPKTFIRQFFNPLFGTKVFALLTVGNGKDLETIKSMIDDGKLKPIVDRVYPFAEIATAHEYSKSGRAKGKIVLEM
jgi:NADPH:quinone reductase-like Zn-dependent oxidoreductase